MPAPDHAPGAHPAFLWEPPLPAIRALINIAASPRDVWNALITPEGLSGWLVQGARIEPRAGGRVVWTLPPAAEAEPVEARGMLHTFRPTSHIEIAWDRGGTFPARGTRMAFSLARDGDETRLSLVHSGEPLDDEALRAELEKGWKRDLKALQTLLDR